MQMKKTNKKIEQELIEKYKAELEKEDCIDCSIYEPNFNCYSKKKHADIQYVDKNGIEWFIEAKSFKSPDKNNAVHKIFGELLKISGLEKKCKNVQYGILIDDFDFLNEHLKLIPKEKLEKFAEIIDCKNGITVFVKENEEKTKIKNWNDFVRRTLKMSFLSLPMF